MDLMAATDDRVNKPASSVGWSQARLDGLSSLKFVRRVTVREALVGA